MQNVNQKWPNDIKECFILEQCLTNIYCLFVGEDIWWFGSSKPWSGHTQAANRAPGQVHVGPPLSIQTWFSCDARDFLV